MFSLSSQGEIVHAVRDKLGNILVIDYRKHRVMTFDSVFEQSKIERERPWLPVHEYNRAMLLPTAYFAPENALVLGLGGGVLVSGLMRLLPDIQVQAVELRPRVVEVARSHFGLPDSDRLNVFCGDARRYVEESEPGCYDLILTDLYQANRMSPAQSQRQFICQCSRALTDRGWLALNFHRMPDENGTLFREIRRQFASVLVFRSKTNNYVIYGSKQMLDPVEVGDGRLLELEQRLPIGWKKLMAKLSNSSPANCRAQD
jgi:spermidine synthase